MLHAHTHPNTDTHMRSLKNPRGRSSWDDLVHNSARATSGYNMVGRPRTTYHSYECVENNNNDDDDDDNARGVYRKDGMNCSVRIVIWYSDFCIHIIIIYILCVCVCVWVIIINILAYCTKRALEIEPVPRRISIGLSNYTWLLWVIIWYLGTYTSKTLLIIKFREFLVYGTILS